MPTGDHWDYSNSAGSGSLGSEAAVSVILPAYNEAEGVGPQVETVRRVLDAQHITYEVIVVDDGSTDQSADRSLRAGARVLQHVTNRGYGAAIKSGILAAKYDTIAMLDADCTYPADQIPALLMKLASADMVVGARTGTQVHIPWLRQPGKWLLGRLATHIAGRPIPDLNSGLRVFRRDCAVQYFPILSDQFSFTSTITLALLADDYQVVYHPINYYPRVGQSKIRPQHFMDFMILVIRIAMLFQPLKIFLPLSLTFGLLGGLKLIFDILAFFPRHPGDAGSLLYNAVISQSAMLLLLSAFLLLLIGMVADGVIRRIAQHNRPLVPSRAVRLWDSSLHASEENKPPAARP